MKKETLVCDNCGLEALNQYDPCLCCKSTKKILRILDSHTVEEIDLKVLCDDFREIKAKVK